MAAVPLSDLRARIAALEGRAPASRGGEPSSAPSAARVSGALGSPAAGPGAPARRFGVALLEQLYPLGARPAGTVHDVTSEGHRDAGALTGFAAALVARMGAAAGPVVWVADAVTAGETGSLYGPGLAAFGIDPARLLQVTARSAAEALWAIEEALSVGGLAAIVGEIGGAPRALDLTATRRLALRAERCGTPVLLLRPAGPAIASAARLRFAIAPRPSGPDPHGLAVLGRPGFAVHLTRNRGGPTGTADVEFCPHDHRFRPRSSTDSQPLAAEALDRPARPGPAEIVALRRVS
ncbi:protein ImuA [Amorphus suaedae]